MHCSRRYVVCPGHLRKRVCSFPALTPVAIVPLPHHADARGGRPVNRTECAQSAGTSPFPPSQTLSGTLMLSPPPLFLVPRSGSRQARFPSPRVPHDRADRATEPTSEGTSAPQHGVYDLGPPHSSASVRALHECTARLGRRGEPHNRHRSPWRGRGRGPLLLARPRRRWRAGVRRRERAF